VSLGPNNHGTRGEIEIASNEARLIRRGAACRNRTDDLLITSGLEYVSGQFTTGRTVTFAQVSAGVNASTGR